VGLGAALLLLSLFLNWYRRGVDAWTAFEAWDLILAALAVVALVAVLSRLGFGAPRPASWMIGPGVASLVIVVFLIINPPPVVAGADASGTGLWLALVAAILMALGALLSVARVSVALTTATPPADAGGTRPVAGHADHDPAAPAHTGPGRRL